MDIKRLSEIEERRVLAARTVSELCLGTRRWVMSVPAEPKHDPDLIISESLFDLRDLVAYCKSLRSEAAELARDVTNLIWALRPELEAKRVESRFDSVEHHLFSQAKESLSRPSIAELLGGK